MMALFSSFQSSSSLNYNNVVLVNPVPIYVFFSVIVLITGSLCTALFKIQAIHFRPLSSWVPLILLPISSLLTWFFGSRPGRFHWLPWVSFTTMVMIS